MRARLALPDAIFAEERHHLERWEAGAAGTGTREGMRSNGHFARRGLVMRGAADAWDGVPQRLRWW